MSATAGAIRAGRAFVEVFSEDSKLVRGLQASLKRCREWGKAVTKAGAGLFSLGSGGVAGLVALSRSFADAGSELGDMSDRTGMGVEALSELRFAAEQTGTDLAAVETGLAKMQKTLADAARGGKKAISTFERIGLSARDLAGLAPEEQFALLARRITAIEDPAQRTAAVMSLFGKSGTALLPLMQQLDDLKARAHELGAVLTTDDKEAADAFGDSLGELSAAVGGVKNAIGAALAPLLTEVATALADGISRIGGWIRENRGLVVGALAGSAALAALGAAVVATGASLTALAAIGTAVGTVLAAVTSPVGAVFALVATGVGLLVTQTDAGRAALESLRSTAVEAFGGVKRALASGDFRLAARIVWAALQLEWEKGIAFLEERWEAGKNRLLDLWTSLGPALANITLDMLGEIDKRIIRFFDAVNHPGRWIRRNVAGDDLPELSPEAQREIDRIDLESALRQGTTSFGTGAASALRDSALEKLKAEQARRIAERDRAFRELLEQASEPAASDRQPQRRSRSVTEQLKQVREQLPDQQVRVSSVGTFSAAAAGRLQGTTSMLRLTSAAERTAKHTEQIAENTERAAEAFEGDHGDVWE